MYASVVLEGSIPGPFLFLICIHDFGNASHVPDPSSFLDDANLFLFCHDMKTLSRVDE